MNRTDRLLAIVLELQGKKTQRAEDLAATFEISKRTVYRDIQALSEAGVPVISVPGTGYSLMEDYFLPPLSFTADEAWAGYRPNEKASVHLTTFPEGLDAYRDDALAAKWEIIRDVRRVVTGALELERAAKRIGSSLEASPMVHVTDTALFAALVDVDLAEVCITSNAMLTNAEAPADAFRLNDVANVAVVVEQAAGRKCARSWKILPTVGDDPDYPDVSPRDAAALREWKALGLA